MYLETANNVTVGVGFLLATPDAAAAVRGFQLLATKAAAVPQQIRDEWANVKKYGNAFKNALFLPDAAIDAELSNRVDPFLKTLASRYPGFAGFPDEAQLALLDMIYNLGAGGMDKSRWPALDKAIAARDWKAAAAACHRQGVGSGRNDATKKLFLAAAVKQPLA